MSLSGKVLGLFTVHDEEGPKPTKEEELRAQADRHVDLTINMLGTAAAEVLDLFGGSGSTLIACERTDRSCYMMELEPHYCDVIIKRWEDYTGEKAVRS